MTNNKSNGLILLMSLLFFLQGCSSRTAPAPVVNLNIKQKSNVIKKHYINSKYYIVKKGDTLYSIAFSSGKDFIELAKLNNIPAPYFIYPGQQLSLNSSNSRHTAKTTKSPLKSGKKPKQQSIDQPKKKAYRKDTVNTKSEGNSGFPQRVHRWQWPGKGKIVSKFSLAPEGNKGIDISGRKGSPISAAADGKVVYTGDALRGYGKLIIVKHSDAYLSAYAHNDKILVKEQQWVKAGQKIAQMGKTGSEDIKLHFEIRYKGKSVDPLRYLPKK